MDSKDSRVVIKTNSCQTVKELVELGPSAQRLLRYSKEISEVANLKSGFLRYPRGIRKVRGTKCAIDICSIISAKWKIDRSSMIDRQ